jgi:hypothetical protein
VNVENERDCRLICLIGRSKVGEGGEMGEEGAKTDAWKEGVRERRGVLRRERRDSARCVRVCEAQGLVS